MLFPGRSFDLTTAPNPADRPEGSQQGNLRNRIGVAAAGCVAV